MQTHFLALVAALLACSAALAQQKPAANYRGASPADNALVKRAEASRWRDSSPKTIESRLGTPNLNQTQDCITQIGQQPEPDKTGHRFGPGNNQRDVVVVTGSVINICK